MYKIENLVKQISTYLKKEYMGTAEIVVEAQGNKMPYYIQKPLYENWVSS